jgi:hypothetical protein
MGETMNKKQQRGKRTKQREDVEHERLELTEEAGQNLETLVVYQLRAEQDLD